MIANNLFINFGSSAIEVWGNGDQTHLPSANTTITGNIFQRPFAGPSGTGRFLDRLSLPSRKRSIQNTLICAQEAD